MRPASAGRAYTRTLATYLREKYASRPPDVIVAVSDEALRFLLRNRAELFPQAPVVHMAIPKTLLRVDSGAARRRGRRPDRIRISAAPSTRHYAGIRRPGVWCW